MPIFISRFLKCLIGAALVAFASGCGYKYTSDANSIFEKSVLAPTTFAILPLSEIAYLPPSGCLNVSNPAADKTLYQDRWNTELVNRLKSTFVKQKFVSLNEKDPFFSKPGYSVAEIRSLASQHILSQKIPMTDDSKTTFHETPFSSRLQPIFTELSNTTNAEYVVLFLTPSLSGETQTTYSYSPQGGSASSTTYFTADIRVQVWECKTGKLMYCSGAWEKSGGFCFFVTPQEMAIQNSTKDMLDRLMLIIAQAIARCQDARVALR